MKTQSKKQFISPSRGPLEVGEMIRMMAEFVDEEPSSFYSVVIGTDSQSRKTNGKEEIDYVTAVIIHRRGKGARYFWRKEKKLSPSILRDKIYTETLMSLSVAQDIVPELRQVIPPSKYDLEIHIDVGPFGPTREMIKEVVGMVSGNGFTARTKPEAWGASSVADKHT